MKKSIILLIIFLSSIENYSQTNRYTELSTASYKTLDVDYYEVQAHNKVRFIGENSQKLHDKINNIMWEIDYDQNDYESWLYLALNYINETHLKPLLIGKKMSLADAEWHYKKAKKMFKSTIRKYNKMIKKLEKTNKL